MKAIGIAITSSCVTAVKLKTFFGLKKVTAIHTENINWEPFAPVPICQVTDALKSIHQKLKLSRADVSLCIPNYYFLTHNLEPPLNKSKKMSKDELDYLFEENLPVDIERIVVRHSRLKADKQSYFCISSSLVISSVKPLLSRINEANINVSHLSGDIFYVGSLIAKKIKADVIAICVWHNLTSVILIRKKKIVLARYLNIGCEYTSQKDASEFKQDIVNRYLSELKLTLANIKVDKEKTQILALGNGICNIPLQNKISEIFGLDENPKPVLNKTAVLSKRQVGKLHSLPEIFAFAAARAVISPSRFDFNFCCSQLLPSVGYKKLYKPLMAIAAIFVVIIATVSFRFYKEGITWQQQSLFYRQQQSQIWRDVFPDLAVPSDITMRLASEKKRLEGLAGQGTGLPSYKSSLDTLQSLISDIPDYIDLRIKDIKIDQDKVVITGQAKNFTMVEHLTTALEQLREFNMQPAQSKRVNEHIVGFTLTGQIINYNQTTDSKLGSFKQL